MKYPLLQDVLCSITMIDYMYIVFGSKILLHPASPSSPKMRRAASSPRSAPTDAAMRTSVCQKFQETSLLCKEPPFSTLHLYVAELPLLSLIEACKAMHLLVSFLPM